MATNNKTYLDGRDKYKRTQAVLFADQPPTTTTVGGKIFYIPQGYEVGESGNNDDDFLILSDHNRQPMNFSTIRIENRQRTINGRMRSYHIADKLQLNLSWDLLPSRAFAADAAFNSSGVANSTAGTSYTIDGGAGGVEILEWYENHTGSFYVFLAYDKYTNFADDGNRYTRLSQYNEVIEMFISDFSYNVQKRGGNNYDMWNISMTLEEA